MRILVSEDDPHLGPALKKGLEHRGYAVDLVTDGVGALTAALGVPYDLVILDVLLPRLSGFDVCRELRERGRATQVLFLTALGDVEHRIEGLDLGGDDYLTKPFDFGELEARVRALLRRETTAKTSELRFADLTLDTRTREVHRGDRPITLRAKEYALLEFLMRHPRQVLSRRMIADHVWDEDAEHLSNVIDVYVAYLRRKLCELGEPDVIQSIRGVGYALREGPTGGSKEEENPR
jgi:DNA-binding response OmpR family regulator